MNLPLPLVSSVLVLVFCLLCFTTNPPAWKANLILVALSAFIVAVETARYRRR